MAQAKPGDTVKVHYTGKLPDGEVFDSSYQRDPLQFTVGDGQVIPGFEQAVAGMEPGQTRSVTIEPEQAYGQRRDDMVMELPRDRLPEKLEPKVGERLQLHTQDGRQIAVAVTDTSPETITIDANHPLAGKDLLFEIELLEIA
ncbi:MAG: peptidylprolyl isomerase [Sedimentisphaerales bacterium]|nr:peptidylprolyl isomerase [Sedimentisphaerales bacterium]